MSIGEGMMGGFGTIRNNTALKPVFYPLQSNTRFGTIRNNTALKRPHSTIQPS